MAFRVPGLTISLVGSFRIDHNRMDIWTNRHTWSPVYSNLPVSRGGWNIFSFMEGGPRSYVICHDRYSSYPLVYPGDVNRLLATGSFKLHTLRVFEGQSMLKFSDSFSPDKAFKSMFIPPDKNWRLLGSLSNGKRAHLNHYENEYLVLREEHPHK